MGYFNLIVYSYALRLEVINPAYNTSSPIPIPQTIIYRTPHLLAHKRLVLYMYAITASSCEH